MKQNIGRTMFVYTAAGIGIAAFISMVASAIAGAAMGGETGSMLVKQFIVMLLVGIGYGLPAVIWTNDRMAMWMKAIVALVPGTIIYTAAAWWIGWIPRQYGIGAVIGFIIIALLFTSIIAAICGFVFRDNVHHMNVQLKQRQQSDASSNA